jgi:ribosomal protein S12 methylthiotransferase
MGAEPEERSREKYPKRARRHRPASVRERAGAVHTHCRRSHDPFVDLVPPQGRIKLTPRHYAYLKISEGCNNRCSFCIIPKCAAISSRARSPRAARGRTLVKAGVKELLVISQDTSAYGVDLKYAESKCATATCPRNSTIWREELGKLGVWVRLHYVYPYPHVDERHPADGRGQDPALSRHPVPARQPERAEGHAPPGQSQEKTLDRIKRWRAKLPRPRHPLDLHRRLPRRDGGRFRASCSTG